MIGIDISILGQKQGKGKRVVVGRGGQDRNKRNRDGGDNWASPEIMDTKNVLME
jgi:hypothetical protein